MMSCLKSFYLTKILLLWTNHRLPSACKLVRFNMYGYIPIVVYSCALEEIIMCCIWNGSNHRLPSACKLVRFNMYGYIPIVIYSCALEEIIICCIWNGSFIRRAIASTWGWICIVKAIFRTWCGWKNNIED